MIIDQTPLDFEIKRVIESDFIANFHRYTGQFKIGEEVLDVIKILSIDEPADYELEYAAPMMLTVVLPLGDFSNKIFPEHGNLEFILKTEMTNPDTNVSSPDEGSILVRTYNVSLDPKLRPYAAEDNGSETLSGDIQNLVGLVEIDIQLKPKLLDDISKVTVGGHFINTTNADCLTNLITYYCAQLDLDDDDKLIGVNMSGEPSQIVKKSIQIDHGLPLSDLADFLQKKAGGIYPTGMAQFVHERIWHIFPPYDTSGFDAAQEKLVVISIPAKRYPHLNKTYLTENGITTILATGDKRIISDKQQIRDNAGNGTMFTDASQIVNGFSTEKGNTAVIKRAVNNNEFLGEASDTGKNNVRMSTERITDNPFLARTRLARSQGHFWMFEWQNADPGIIKPALNVKIMFLNEGEVCEISGVLVKCHRQTRLNGKGLMATGFRTSCVLVVFVKSSDGENSGLLGLD